MSSESLFHEDELEVQKRAGEEAAAEANSPMLADKLYPGAMTFIRHQQMAILSTRDVDGHRWASVVFGPKGFLDPNGRESLYLVVPAAERDARDPLWQNLEKDPRLGLLIIELANRRRLRINGDAIVTDSEIVLNVTQTFPNCPKYITKREIQVELAEVPDAKSKVAEGTSLPAPLQKLIAAADVLFLATGHAERGNDASHRGGRPGFLELINKNTVRFPTIPATACSTPLATSWVTRKSACCSPISSMAARSNSPLPPKFSGISPTRKEKPAAPTASSNSRSAAGSNARCQRD